MSTPRIFAIVPARMASTRFPNKPLAKILSLPMVEHVRRRALLAEGVAEVIVATCDQEILEAVTAAGGKAVMTAATHQRANDRVAEAMRGLDAAPDDVVAVVQGDEPNLLPSAIQHVAAPLLTDPAVQCTILLSPLESAADFNNPNIVKAACNLAGNVFYLSRAPIPYFQKPGSACPIYRETGLRAFRAAFLQTYCALPPTPFEQAEAVDMLRLLEHGYTIRGAPVDYSTLGVDHPEELPLAERHMLTDPVQRALYEQTK
jgi:3-deoxy-manno-octulosonate cytidylyltransferase (CMP-KDO synthetase)